MCKKIENFWFYYKWYVLGGLFLLATLVVGIHSCSVKKDPDMQVLFAVDHSPNSLAVQELEEWLGGLTTDINGDGESTAMVISTATTDQWNGYNSGALLMQVNSGKAVLYIVSEKNYEVLHENGVLQELPGKSDCIQGDRYLLKESGALKDVPAFAEDEQQYFLCIRKVKGTTLEGKEHYICQEKLAFEVLEQLIEKE